MAFRDPKDQEAFNGLWGLPQAPGVPAPITEQDIANFPQPEPEPELAPWTPPSDIGVEPIDGLPFGSQVQDLPTTIEAAPEDASRSPYGPGYRPTIENQMAQAGQVDQRPAAPALGPGDSVRTGGGGQSVSSGSSESRQRLVEKDEGNYTAPQPGDIGYDQYAITEARRNEVDAIRAGQAAESAHNAAVSEDLKNLAIQDKKDAEEDQRADAIMNQRADERIAGVADAMEAVKSMKVDPTRIWTQNGEANRVAGIAAAFIGGFLQPVLGTNTIQQTIDRAIDRDIAAQKSDIEGAQRNVGNLKQLHALGLSQAETEDEQRAQDRLLRRSALIGTMQAETAQFQDKILKAKAESEIAKLNTVNVKELKTMRDEDKARAQSKYEFEKKEKRLRQVLYSQSKAQNDARSDRRDNEAYKRGRDARQDAIDDAKVPDAVPGAQNPIGGDLVGSYKNSKDTAGNDRFDQRLQARHDLSLDLRELHKMQKAAGVIYSGFGQDYVSSPEAVAIKSRYAKTLSKYLHTMTGATSNPADLARAKSALPPPESILKVNPDSAWKEMLGATIDQQNADNNIKLRDPSTGGRNTWDVTKEWGFEVEAAPKDKTPSYYADLIQSGTPKEKLRNAAELVKSLDPSREKESVIFAKDPEIGRALDALDEMSPEDLNNSDLYFPDWKGGVNVDKGGHAKKALEDIYRYGTKDARALEDKLEADRKTKRAYSGEDPIYKNLFGGNR